MLTLGHASTGFGEDGVTLGQFGFNSRLAMRRMQFGGMTATLRPYPL